MAMADQKSQLEGALASGEAAGCEPAGGVEISSAPVSKEGQASSTVAAVIKSVLGVACAAVKETEPTHIDSSQAKETIAKNNDLEGSESEAEAESESTSTVAAVIKAILAVACASVKETAPTHIGAAQAKDTIAKNNELEGSDSKAESESTSDSDSSDDGSSSSDNESSAEDKAVLDKGSAGSALSADLAGAAAALQDMEREGAADTIAPGAENEDLNTLEVPRPTVEVTEAHTLSALGRVSGVMAKTVIVMSAAANIARASGTPSVASERELAEATALDAGSIVCFEDRTVLGEVFETFGPVTAPLYIIRFNCREEIDAVKAEVGREVFSIQELCKTVRARDVRRKGYDGSDFVDQTEDFSDDEAEKTARLANKRSRWDPSRAPGPGRMPKRVRHEPRQGRATHGHNAGWTSRHRGQAFVHTPGHPTAANVGMPLVRGFAGAPRNMPLPPATPNNGHWDMQHNAYRNISANVNYSGLPMNQAGLPMNQAGLPMNHPGPPMNYPTYPGVPMNRGIASVHGHTYPNTGANVGYSSAPYMRPTPAYPPQPQWVAPIQAPGMYPGVQMMPHNPYPGGMSAPFATRGPSSYGQPPYYQGGPAAPPTHNQPWPGSGNGSLPNQHQGHQGYQWQGSHNFPPPPPPQQ